MTNFATAARTKTDALVPASVLLPSMLAVNTLALYALNAAGSIPNWLKTAAALFLAF